MCLRYLINTSETLNKNLMTSSVSSSQLYQLCVTNNLLLVSDGPRGGGGFGFSSQDFFGGAMGGRGFSSFAGIGSGAS